MGWQPSPEILRDAFVHAEACAPMECCGLVVGGVYRPLVNQSTESHRFVIGPRDLVAWRQEGTVDAIVHSHVGLPAIASPWDVEQCAQSDLPWLILSLIDDEAGKRLDYSVIEPPGLRAPLVGRRFVWGSQDCWGLVRDAYLDYAGMVLPDFPREWEWWKHGENLIVDRIDAAGFVRIEVGAKIEHLDLIGIKHRSDVINHLGVFLWPDVMLHHMVDRLSTRHTYGGLWRDETYALMRHKRFMPPGSAPAAGVLTPRGAGGAESSTIIAGVTTP